MTLRNRIVLKIESEANAAAPLEARLRLAARFLTRRAGFKIEAIRFQDTGEVVDLDRLLDPTPPARSGSI